MAAAQEERGRGAHAEAVRRVLGLLEHAVGGARVALGGLVVDATGGRGRLEEVVGDVARVLLALGGEERVGEAPEAVLLGSRGGQLTGLDGVLADEREQVQFELELAGTDVALDDRREHVAGVGAAERALQVGELHERHGRRRRAEPDAVLREPGEARAHGLRLRDGVLLGEARDGDRSRGERERGRRDDDQSPARSTPLRGLAFLGLDRFPPLACGLLLLHP
ncbi:hypothetical protein OJ997_22540 [Solirubrobacter phytolaccae]|uniref:Uncharacterized protein n=1 Tax=Solirubrobacter phytolaccae TaxID=1404360 RepID=A0A9X3NDV1_9ACTN|nr:hypothetical protein [Solirubrobacter phytolaccae]MDA0183105.1 hypothetical protein [Solirubrobacter phytolaccae]